jgi:hypothetical protein
VSTVKYTFWTYVLCSTVNDRREGPNMGASTQPWFAEDAGEL